MTREEMIEHLKLLKDSAVKSAKDTALIDVKIDSFYFVIDAAVDALEQEPCYKDCRLCKEFDECVNGRKGHENGTSIGYSIGECKDYKPCDDAISRAELIGLLKSKIKTHRSTIEIADKLIPLIEKLSSVTPSRRKGHWIKVEDNGKISYQCSCGCAYKQNFNFCPNCGADMRGAE